MGKSVKYDTNTITTLKFDFLENGVIVGQDAIEIKLFGTSLRKKTVIFGTMCLVADPENKKILPEGCVFQQGNQYIPRYIHGYLGSDPASPQVNLVVRDYRDPYVKELPYRNYASRSTYLILGTIFCFAAVFSCCFATCFSIGCMSFMLFILIKINIFLSN